MSPATVTMVSRGMDSTLTCPVAGMTWTILTTSLRWPPAVASLPKCDWSAGLTSARESDPMSSTLKGCPTGAALRCLTVTLATWSNRYCT